MNKVKSLTEGIISDMVSFIVEDNKITVMEAMDIVYSSTLFDKLSDCETGLYRESSAYVYALLKDEIIHGKIVQKEI
jgi:hypothetical protein